MAELLCDIGGIPHRGTSDPDLWAAQPYWRNAEPYERSFSVTSSFGAMPCFVRSFCVNRSALLAVLGPTCGGRRPRDRRHARGIRLPASRTTISSNAIGRLANSASVPGIRSSNEANIGGKRCRRYESRVIKSGYPIHCLHSPIPVTIPSGQQDKGPECRLELDYQARRTCGRGVDDGGN
jgi:hypothetical protein